MSPRQASQDSSGGGLRAAVTALLVVGVAAAMLLLVRAAPGSEPFDPRSGDDDGTRGLVLLLEEYGATVDVARSVPEPGDGGRLLVLQDRMDDAQRNEIVAWVEAGGLAVVADPLSDLTAGHMGTTPIDLGDAEEFGFETVPVPLGQCSVPALQHLSGLEVADGVRFAVPEAARGCFGTGGSAFAVAEPRGDGVMVALGGNLPFVNRYLRFEDNAALATALLAPTPGTQVTILLGTGAAKTAADIGTGERSLADLVRPGVWMALAQLAVAFLVLVVARAVRPGRPVREPEQVPIAGSELVVATGNLMQRARHAQRAGWLLRGNLYRQLCRRLHLAPDSSIERVDREAARVLGTTPGTVGALLEREVHDDAALLSLTADLQQVRELAAVSAGSAAAHIPTDSEGALS